jgi:hypothetical protein
MLFGQLRFEAAETFIPERSLHDRRALAGTDEGVETGKGRGVYTGAEAVDISKKSALTGRGKSDFLMHRSARCQVRNETENV